MPNNTPYFTRDEAYADLKPIFHRPTYAKNHGYESRSTLLHRGIKLPEDRKPDAYAVSNCGPMFFTKSGRKYRSYVGYYKVEQINQTGEANS